MADIYLHSKLTEELIRDNSYAIDEKIAFLGSQGPDPMYYSGGKEYRDVADDIHRYQTRSFLKTMVEYVKQNNTIQTYSFLFGFLSHYAMDVSIHPYVYYKTGLYKKEDPSTHHLRGLHLKFERSIDCLQIEKDFQIPSKKMRLTKKYFPLSNAPEAVIKLMDHTLTKVWKVSDGYTMYERSVKAMYQTTKNFVTDRFGCKKLLLKIVDLFSRKQDMFFSDVSMYNHLQNYDYHNDTKSVWLHPLTGEPRTDSIDDIFDNAKQFALEMINQVNLYLFTNQPVNLDAVFTDLSFNSGKPCDMGMDFTYFGIYNEEKTK